MQQRIGDAGLHSKETKQEASLQHVTNGRIALPDMLNCTSEVREVVTAFPIPQAETEISAASPMEQAETEISAASPMEQAESEISAASPMEQVSRHGAEARSKWSQ